MVLSSPALVEAFLSEPQITAIRYMRLLIYLNNNNIFW